MKSLKERNKIALAFQKEVGLWFNEHGFCARRVVDTRDAMAFHDGAAIGRPQPCDWTVFQNGTAINIEVKCIFKEKTRMSMGRTTKSQLGLMAYEWVNGGVPGYFLINHIPAHRLYAAFIGQVADRKYDSYFPLSDAIDITTPRLEWFRARFYDLERSIACPERYRR